MKSIYLILVCTIALNFFTACSEDNGNTDTGEVVTSDPAAEESTKEYELVWSDEFDETSNRLPNPQDWWFESGGNGWGNNELQNYLIDGYLDSDTTALVSNGTLKISAIKRDYQGNKYLSARLNTKQSWQYGKFEARIKVPAGRGCWPAFWMLPKDFRSWPLDGEIDIMEYVGYDPHTIHGTIHTQAYNHSIGTQKGKSTTVKTAETQFHIYTLEWTKDKIRIAVDDNAYFTFSNDGSNNKDTWPFNAPFYLKLNLAVGGDWGGAQGIDDTIFPIQYEIDYVRVYQMK